MTPSARVKATIDLLEIIAVSKIPMDGTIGDYMRHRRYIGSKDRAAIAQRTYDVMRAYSRILWWLKKTEAEDTPRNHVIAWLMLGEQVTEIKKLFDGDKYGPAILTELDRKLVAALQDKDLNDETMPDFMRAECPQNYESKLRSYFGDDFETEMNAMIPGATLDLRVNACKIKREEVQNSLRKDGIETDITPYSPTGLRAKKKVHLAKSKAFRKGWIEIQDEGSQLIAHICGAQPGMQVLDYCAGAGGKTLALASAMNVKGRIVAMDIEQSRLNKAKTRFKRAGVSDIIEVRPLSEEKARKWYKRQKGTFDIVLADVPCSGSGTWRRNPDTRWREYGPPLAEIIKTQTEILDKIAKAVKPGGKLIYATCSLLPEENEQQIEAFLENHKEFSLAPLPDDVPCDGPYMRLTPHRHNTDGFFAAVLLRAS